MLTRRNGFSLVEVVVAVVLVATLAAVTVPALRGRMRDGYADALTAEVNSVVSALQAYRRDVGHYPPSLVYLNILPTSGLLSPPTDNCSPPHNLTTLQMARYQGPYISRTITGSKYVINRSDTVATSLTIQLRNLGGSNSVNTIAFTITGVDYDLAQDVDKRLDGNVTATPETTGQWQWVTNANTNLVNATFYMPIKTGDC
jgi:prepilin-type N-terminal cleavage/methylation domain-containing protein